MTRSPCKVMATIGHRQNDDIVAEASFTDTAACRCALRPIAEQGVIDPENTQAWRCIADATQDVYKGLSGVWYFSLPEEYHAVDGGRGRLTALLRPDTKTGYAARLANGNRLRLRSLRRDQRRLVDERCTGEIEKREVPEVKGSTDPVLAQRAVRPPSSNSPTSSDDDDSSLPVDDTSTIDHRSETSTDEVPGLASSLGQMSTGDESRAGSTCLGGDLAIGVPLQNRTGWRETKGCLPGFLCEFDPFTSSNLY